MVADALSSRETRLSRLDVPALCSHFQIHRSWNIKASSRKITFSIQRSAFVLMQTDVSFRYYESLNRIRSPNIILIHGRSSLVTFKYIIILRVHVFATTINHLDVRMIVYYFITINTTYALLRTKHLLFNRRF